MKKREDAGPVDIHNYKKRLRDALEKVSSSHLPSEDKVAIQQFSGTLRAPVLRWRYKGEQSEGKEAGKRAIHLASFVGVYDSFTQRQNRAPCSGYKPMPWVAVSSFFIT